MIDKSFRELSKKWSRVTHDILGNLFDGRDDEDADEGHQGGVAAGGGHAGDLLHK